MNFSSLDISLLFSLNGLAGKSPPMDALIITVANYVPIALIAYCAWRVYRRKGIAFTQKVRIGAIALFAGFVARYVIGTPIRHFFPRPRPFVTYNLHQLIAETSVGFPSGHALFFFAFSAVIYAYDRKLGLFAFLVSLLVCIGRVTAGIHYPTDIIAGAVLGTLVGYLGWRLAVGTGFIRI